MPYWAQKDPLLPMKPAPQGMPSTPDTKCIGQDFIITDTAGIRKKAKVKEDIEFYSVMRSLRTLEESDVLIIMVDATRGLEAQDVNLDHPWHQKQQRNHDHGQ
jgi:predicted GTPase